MRIFFILINKESHDLDAFIPATSEAHQDPEYYKLEHDYLERNNPNHHVRNITVAYTPNGTRVLNTYDPTKTPSRIS